MRDIVFRGCDFVVVLGSARRGNRFTGELTPDAQTAYVGISHLPTFPFGGIVGCSQEIQHGFDGDQAGG